jgi:hypothetical protein
LIGAGRYERTKDPTNERNGHRSRVLTTKASEVELAIPNSGAAASSPPSLSAASSRAFEPLGRIRRRLRDADCAGLAMTDFAGVGVLARHDQIPGYFPELDIEVLGGSTQYCERLF